MIRLQQQQHSGRAYALRLLSLHAFLIFNRTLNALSLVNKRRSGVQVRGRERKVGNDMCTLALLSQRGRQRGERKVETRCRAIVSEKLCECALFLLFLFGKFSQVDKQQTNPGITSSESLQKLNTPK